MSRRDESVSEWEEKKKKTPGKAVCIDTHHLYAQVIFFSVVVDVVFLSNGHVSLLVFFFLPSPSALI